MATWAWTWPCSFRTSPLSPPYVRSRSSSTAPTSPAVDSTRSRCAVARRKGVGMYTVTMRGACRGAGSPEAEVALAGVGQDRHHRLRRRQLGRDLAGRPRGGARRDPGEEALLAAEPARPRGGVLVTHRDDAID